MFQVGDRVVVQTVKEMAEEYGSINHGGDWVSNRKYPYAFVSGMRRFCGKEFYISRRTIHPDYASVFVYELESLSGEHSDYAWHDYMLKPAQISQPADESEIALLYE